MDEFTDGHARSLIPLKFHFSSGLKSHDFRILLPSWNPAYREDEEKGLFRCAVRYDSGTLPKLISRDVIPCAFEALKLVSGVDGESTRVQRYLAVHSAYEAVITARDPDLSAIRHSLAHPAALLSNAVIVESLERRFGSTSINLHDYYHQKEYYRSLGAMLIAIDAAVFELLPDWSRPNCPSSHGLDG